MNPTRRLAVLATVLLIGPMIAAGCSLPEEDRVAPIDADELGPELANPTTTTTTTLPATTVPTPTDPSLSQPSTTTTTTIEATPTGLRRIFYTIGSSDDLARMNIPLREDAGYAAMRSELESPRSLVGDEGLRTAVRPGLIESFVFDRITVTLTVALDATVFESMPESQKRRAIAQIVLTFTSFAPPDSGAIAFVNFTVEDDPISVFVPLTGSSSDAGAPLRFADFQPWLDADVETVVTDPPTATSEPEPTVTEPPPTSEG